MIDISNKYNITHSRIIRLIKKKKNIREFKILEISKKEYEDEKNQGRT
jgi:hypothetical protein